MTGDELRRQQIRNAADALRSLPGVSVSRGGSFGAQTQVRIRGAEANHTLVLIDGVVANDTNNGAFDFSDLSAENIERIEVIRGPQSGLYGSNALGGVINIVTDGRARAARACPRAAKAGSFGTFDYAVRASGGNERAWGSVSLPRAPFHRLQRRPASASRTTAPRSRPFMAKGGVQIADGLVLDFMLRYSDKRGDRDTEGGPVGTLAVQVDDPATFQATVFLGGRQSALGHARWRASRMSCERRATRRDIVRHLAVVPDPQYQRDAALRLSRHVAVRHARR